MEYRNQNILGHCVDVLKQLPTNIFQTAITSPPYYRMRDYHIQHQVWQALRASALCETGEHNWIENTKIVKKHTQGEEGSSLRGGRVHEDEAWNAQTGKISSQSYTCTTCNAWKGQLGLEPSPHLFIEHLVYVCREIRRTLRDDGILWLNIGDTYAGSGKGGRDGQGEWGGSKQQTNIGSIRVPSSGDKCFGLKPKDLMLVPQRLAIALQDDGWWVRGMFPWYKKNAFPESVKDRPTLSHEYWIMLTKSKRYFFDYVAVSQQVNGELRSLLARILDTDIDEAMKTLKGRNFRSSDIFMLSIDDIITWYKNYIVVIQSLMTSEGMLFDEDHNPFAFLFNTNPSRHAHFATFHKKMLYILIKSSTSKHGACAKCGSPYTRQTEEVPLFSISDTEETAEYSSKYAVEGQRLFPQDTIVSDMATERKKSSTDARLLFPENPQKQKVYRRLVHEFGNLKTIKTLEWEKTCTCNMETVTPCIVLDPFGGSGTTALASIDLGRNFTSIDLNSEYQQDIANPLLERKQQQYTLW